MIIVALDLETTGVDKQKDKIIEIAMVKFQVLNGKIEILETFSSLINPGIKIPEVISNITNIFDKDVVDSPFFDEKIIKETKDFIQDFPILGHNTYFDRDFLLNAGVDVENNIILDTFYLSNIILFKEKSLNLGSLCESFDIDLSNAHRALDDVKGTISLFEKLIGLFKSLSNEKKDLLNFVFSKSPDKSFSLYKEIFLFDKQSISQEDFVKIILNKIGKIKKDEVINKEKLSYQNIQEVFDSFSDFEVRQNQLEMSKIIEKSLNENKKAIIEAPTGVGKTFAYLIPGVIYSLKNSTQVVISTNTKNLQDQIFYKDLEFLSKNLKNSFSYTKLKGRKNYFSISRFFEFFYDLKQFGLEEVSFLSKIVLWLFETFYGELDELNFYQKEYNFLRNIHSDNFLVLQDSNEFKFYEFLFKARNLAQKSDIVIINHSMLIQEFSSKAPILGNIKNLIVDESHNLEDTTTDAVKKSFNLPSLKESFEKINHTLTKNNIVSNILDNKYGFIIDNISFIFDLICDYGKIKNTFGNEVFEFLIDNDFFEKNKDIENILNLIEVNFIEILNFLSTTPDKVYSLLKTEISNLEEISSILKICLNIESKAKFISIFHHNSINPNNNTISYTVLNTGEFLKTNLWDTVENVILTSATLIVKDNFDYIKKILSLDEDFSFFTLNSDFDYKKQALLFIPNDLGVSKYNNPRITDFVLNFLKKVKGRTLVLLTSFSSIKDLYVNLNIPLKTLNINILAQNVGGSKHKIANHFKKYSKNSVILGTDSFWEGVDIPGDDLKYLIIHKFPFEVPSDPVFTARSRLYKNSFEEYSVPKSIIKTKQGFGRLIRTKKDTGIVILLDDRIINTSWGNVMFDAFPKEINTKISSSKNFLDIIKEELL